MLSTIRRKALVSPKFLADRWVFDEIKEFTVLDCSWHLPNTGRNAHEEYKKEHIPRAKFFDIEECADKSSNLPHMLPDLKSFEKYAASLGVTPQTHIIAYDNHPKFGVFSAPRVWWMFKYFGFDNISVLEGGLPSWIEYGGLTTDLEHEHSEEKRYLGFTTKYFMGRNRPHMLKQYEDIVGNVMTEGKRFKVIDARPEGRYYGTSPEPRDDIKPGAIPFSVNIPFTEVLESETRLMKPTDDLLEVFEQAGVNLNEPLTFSCGTGVTAAIVALAAHCCGKEMLPVYDGSWTEYYQKAPDYLKAFVPSGETEV